MVWPGMREVVGAHLALLALLREGVTDAVTFVWRMCEQHLSANMEEQRGKNDQADRIEPL